MTNCEIRLRAAIEIETRGRCKSRTINERGEVCLIGALALAIGIDAEELLKTQSAGGERAYHYHTYPTGLFESIKFVGPCDAFVYNDSVVEDAVVLARLREGCE